MGRLESLLHRNLRYVRAVMGDLTCRPARFPWSGCLFYKTFDFNPENRPDTASSRTPGSKSESLSALLFADLFDDDRQIPRHCRKNRDQSLRLTVDKKHYL